MKTGLLMMMFATCAGSIGAQNSIEIKGKVQFMEDNFKIVAYQYEGSGKKMIAETTVNPDHTYSLKIPVIEPGEVTIDCASWQSVNVWLEDENMDIDFRGQDTAKIKIKNPPYVYIKAAKKNEIMNMINHESYRNYQNMIAISQAVYRSPITDEKQKQEFSFKLYDMNGDDFDAHLRYIAEHYADRTSVLAVLKRLNQEKNKEVIDKALATLEKTPEGTVLAGKYRKLMEAAKEKRERMQEGSLFPDFTAQNIDGKKYSLKNFKGKVLLIDFWASWCGPCRNEIPKLKKYYEELGKNKEVAFLSISIDAKPADWKKALGEENMPWLQLLAPNAGKEVMDSYQFSGIPFIVLIDKDGRIYKKNIRGEQIQTALQEVLSGKKAQAPKSVAAGGMMGTASM